MSSRLKVLLITAVLVFASIQFSNSSFAQHLQQGDPKVTTAAKPTPAADKAPDYSQEAFVIEQLKTIYRFEKDGTGQREVSLRVKVQSEAGVEGFGQLVFAYSSANE